MKKPTFEKQLESLFLQKKEIDEKIEMVKKAQKESRVAALIKAASASGLLAMDVQEMTLALSKLVAKNDQIVQADQPAKTE